MLHYYGNLLTFGNIEGEKGFEKYAESLPFSNKDDVIYEGTPRYLVESIAAIRAKAVNPK